MSIENSTIEPGQEFRYYQQLELRDVLPQNVFDELADDRAVELTPELSRQYMHRWMHELLYQDGRLPKSGDSEMFDFDKEKTYRQIEEDYRRMISEIYAPLTVGWSRWIIDLEQRIPGSRAVFFPRDGYLPAAAYEEIQRARGDEREVLQLQLSRVGVGIKDEVDPVDGAKIDKGAVHYEMVLEYFEEIVNKVKAEGGDTIIIADSLPYGYMMEALFERGEAGFIAQIGNVGEDWKNRTIPDAFLKGLAQAYGIKVVPASFYSMSWLQTYDDAMIHGLPGFLNELAMQNNPDGFDKNTDSLEAVADGLETIFDRHGTVTNFTRDESGKVIPVLNPVPSDLAARLAYAADEAVREKARELIAQPGYGLDDAEADRMFYRDMGVHLTTVINYIQEAASTGWSHGVLPGPLGRIKRHDDFIRYAQRMGGHMFSQVAQNRDAFKTEQKQIL